MNIKPSLDFFLNHPTIKTFDKDFFEEMFHDVSLNENNSEQIFKIIDSLYRLHTVPLSDKQSNEAISMYQRLFEKFNISSDKLIQLINNNIKNSNEEKQQYLSYIQSYSFLIINEEQYGKNYFMGNDKFENFIPFLVKIQSTLINNPYLFNKIFDIVKINNSNLLKDPTVCSLIIDILGASFKKNEKYTNQIYVKFNSILNDPNLFILSHSNDTYHFFIQNYGAEIYNNPHEFYKNVYKNNLSNEAENKLINPILTSIPKFITLFFQEILSEDDKVEFVNKHKSQLFKNLYFAYIPQEEQILRPNMEYMLSYLKASKEKGLSDNIETYNKNLEIITNIVNTVDVNDFPDKHILKDIAIAFVNGYFPTINKDYFNSDIFVDTLLANLFFSKSYAEFEYDNLHAIFIEYMENDTLPQISNELTVKLKCLKYLYNNITPERLNLSLEKVGGIINEFIIPLLPNNFQHTDIIITLILQGFSKNLPTTTLNKHYKDEVFWMAFAEKLDEYYNSPSYKKDNLNTFPPLISQFMYEYPRPHLKNLEKSLLNHVVELSYKPTTKRKI